MVISASQRLNPAFARKTIPGDKTVVLGSIKGSTYFTFDGEEFVLGSQADPGMAPPDGEVVVSLRHVEKLDDGRGSEIDHRTYRRAQRMPSGTYAKEVAEEQASRDKYARRRRPRPSIVRSLAVFGGRRDAIAQGLPRMTEDLMGVVESAPQQVYVPARPPAVGPAAWIIWLRSKGVELELAQGGRLVARYPGGHPVPKYQKAIEDGTPLLLGQLTGHPLVCELAHPAGQAPPATTLVDPGTPSCEAHARGEL